ncbi:hypothetical protein LCGC14_1626320 [marine sediment metagenome]|uniref:Uncharacterized protein n=1 Tax=marine sediment metagenome TaxID=412755 RepID=A0A0F9L3Q2_9ZZZZ
MRPFPLRNRYDLIQALIPYAPTSACKRAMEEGRVSVLGGFQAPEYLPYIVIEITGIRSRSNWLIALVIDEPKYEFSVIYPMHILWEQWVGKADRYNPILDGDEPQLYNWKKNNALTNSAKTTENEPSSSTPEGPPRDNRDEANPL